MKFMQQISFIVLIMLLVFSSCTIQKRVYMPGHYSKWIDSKHKTDRKELVQYHHEKHLRKDQRPLSEDPNTVIADNTSAITNELTRCVENSMPTASGKSVWSYKNKRISPSKPHAQKNAVLKMKSQLTPVLKESIRSEGSGGGRSGLLMVILGLVLIGIGYLFYVTLGILGLILFLILGIGGAIYLIIGLIRMIASS